MKMFFIDTSFILASIMNTKQKHYLECFATFAEVNALRQAMQQEFNKRGLNACITDEVNPDHFDVYDGVYVKKRGLTIEGLEYWYRSHCPSIAISLVLWDDEFISQYIQGLRQPRVQKLPFEPMQLDAILNKILDNPTRFYEKIAGELSKEEYDFIEKLIQDKSCLNCANSCCDGTIVEFGKTQNGLCSNWHNDELVGRRKILVKNN